MIPFIKMHGIGNDFVIIDERKEKYNLDITQIADRRLGVGCDQLIIINKSSKADCSMQIYNQDGTESAACGNATRCIAHIIMQEQTSIFTSIEVRKKILKCWQVRKNYVKVDMGVPLFGWKEIPLSQSCETINLLLDYEGLKEPIVLNIGNPHIVFFVENINSVELSNIGPKIENDPLFPAKVNVSIAQIMDKKILLRVWERGSGKTLACGSAACATLVAAVRKKYISGNSSVISLPGGELYIKWNENIFMTGPVKRVFTGIIENIKL